MRPFFRRPRCVAQQLRLTAMGTVMQVKRRLAQNREAARKSRARKKEYLKRLELEV